MFGFVFTMFFLSSCQPTPLVLNGGSIIWADCGWERIETDVVLHFRDFHFKMKANKVNWEATAIKQQEQSKFKKATAEKDQESWSNFVKNAKPKRPDRPLIITEGILKKRESKQQRQVRPKKQKTARSIRTLEQQILQMTQRCKELRHQLKQDITWKQATFLLKQVDDLEQRIREKQYWLERWKASEKPSPGPVNASRRDAYLQRTNALETLRRLKIVTNGKTCVTLISCYTDLLRGAFHGKSHRHYRGSRA